MSSPTLLSKRLQQLTGAGLVARSPAGPEGVYTLTPAGRELERIVLAVGAWGPLTREDVDICDYDPGHPIAVTVAGTLRCLTLVWRGI